MGPRLRGDDGIELLRNGGTRVGTLSGRTLTRNLFAISTSPRGRGDASTTVGSNIPSLPQGTTLLCGAPPQPSSRRKPGSSDFAQRSLKALDCSARPCASPELRSGVRVDSLPANQSGFRRNDQLMGIRSTRPTTNHESQAPPARPHESRQLRPHPPQPAHRHPRHPRTPPNPARFAWRDTGRCPPAPPTRLNRCRAAA